MVMKCSNPACKKTKFEVTVEHKRYDAKHPERMPVTIKCCKCGKPVKAWLTNEAMKVLCERFDTLALRTLEKFNDISERLPLLPGAPPKPWWQFW